jgi:isochorismate hydrolase
MLKEWWDEIITTQNKYYKLSKEIYLSGAPIVKKTQYDAFYKTDLKKMFKTGIKPMLLGLIVWLAVLFSSLAVQFVTKQM